MGFDSGLEKPRDRKKMADLSAGYRTKPSQGRARALGYSHQMRQVYELTSSGRYGKVSGLLR